jgi:hypothetical protein
MKSDRIYRIVELLEYWKNGMMELPEGRRMLDT